MDGTSQASPLNPKMHCPLASPNKRLELHGHKGLNFPLKTCSPSPVPGLKSPSTQSKTTSLPPRCSGQKPKNHSHLDSLVLSLTSNPPSLTCSTHKGSSTHPLRSSPLSPGQRPPSLASLHKSPNGCLCFHSCPVQVIFPHKVILSVNQITSLPRSKATMASAIVKPCMPMATQSGPCPPAHQTASPATVPKLHCAFTCSSLCPPLSSLSQRPSPTAPG